MPKDYQEIERIVEEFKHNNLLVWHSIAHSYQSRQQSQVDWLRTTLTTYGNARVEEIINIAEGMKVTESRLDTSESVLGQKQCVWNQALTDLIEAIKK